MTLDVVVIGAGGFGREVLDVIEAQNSARGGEQLNVLGVVDDAPTEVNLERLNARGYAHLGSLESTLNNLSPSYFTIGIGNPNVRSRIAKQFLAEGWSPVTLVHPTSTIGSRSALGKGTVVCSGVQVSTNCTLGDFVHLNPGAIVGHDSVIGDYSSVNPGAVVSGEVTIQPRTLVGANATILQGLTIGHDVIVGASACVTKSLGPDQTVKGIPARPAVPVATYVNDSRGHTDYYQPRSQ